MLADAVERAHAASLAVPTHAVVVHAKDAGAAAFYSHFGFSAFPAHPRHLFLPMASIDVLRSQGGS
jgi:hypothetical protein